MEEQQNPGVTTSDESLVARARAGDRSAFAELWQRHARSGLRVARQFTSTIDADDLVSEAYVRIYQRVLAGGGPAGAFRPYLYTTIRNLASRWGQSDRDVNVEDIDDCEAADASSDPVTVALDRTLTVRAFRSLPERWQSVLWYTEVEGMDPHEVAPILGISANGVAALSYRAREGLRKAWLQAHVSDVGVAGECQWTITRLGDYARRGLTTRERTRVSDHLATCARCGIVSEEVEEVGSHLAIVMLPLLLGGAVGGAFLASLGAPSSAMAASLTPVMPPTFGALGSAGSVTAPAVTAGLIAAAVSAPLVGAFAVALVVSGGLAVSYALPNPAPPVSVTIAETHPSQSGAASDRLAPGANGNTPGALDQVMGGIAPMNGALGSAVRGVAPVTGLGTAVGTTADGLVGGLVNDLTNPINTLIPSLGVGSGAVPSSTALTGPVAGAAANSLDLSGTGTSGATVSVQAAGLVYATTMVTAAGAWAVHISSLPNGATQLQLTQTLVSILGVDLVSVPLSVRSSSLAFTLNILGQ